MPRRSHRGAAHLSREGLRGVTHTAQALTRTGLAWDRHWMFVSETGRFITQRECPGLARIDAEVAAGELRLRSQGHPGIALPRAGRRAASRSHRVGRSLSRSGEWCRHT